MPSVPTSRPCERGDRWTLASKVKKASTHFTKRESGPYGSLRSQGRLVGSLWEAALARCRCWLEFRRGALRRRIALVLFSHQRVAVDRGRADDAFGIQQRELRIADPVGCDAQRELHAQRAVAIGAFGVVQHGVQGCFFCLRAFHDGGGTALAVGAVELDRSPRIERPVHGLESGRFLVGGSHAYNLSRAIHLIE